MPLPRPSDAKRGKFAWRISWQRRRCPTPNITNKHYDSGDYPASLLEVKRMIDLRRAAETAEARRESAAISASALRPIPNNRRMATKVFAAWGLPLVPGFDQAHA